MPAIVVGALVGITAGLHLTAAFAVAYTAGLLAVQVYMGALLSDRYFRLPI